MHCPAIPSVVTHPLIMDHLVLNLSVFRSNTPLNTVVSILESVQRHDPAGCSTLCPHQQSHCPSSDASPSFLLENRAHSKLLKSTTTTEMLSVDPLLYASWQRRLAPLNNDVSSFRRSNTIWEGRTVSSCEGSVSQAVRLSFMR